MPLCSYTIRLQSYAFSPFFSKQKGSALQNQKKLLIRISSSVGNSFHDQTGTPKLKNFSVCIVADFASSSSHLTCFFDTDFYYIPTTIAKTSASTCLVIAYAIAPCANINHCGCALCFAWCICSNNAPIHEEKKCCDNCRFHCLML